MFETDELDGGMPGKKKKDDEELQLSDDIKPSKSKRLARMKGIYEESIA